MDIAINSKSRYLSGVYNQIKAALASRTGKDTQLVLFGQVANSFLGFGVNLILIRNLSVHDYGLFSLFNSMLLLMGGFFHLGWIESYVRFGAKHLESAEFSKIRSTLLVRTSISALCLGTIAYFASHWLAFSVYKRAEFLPCLRLAIFGAVATCMYSFILNDRRVRFRFSEYFVFQVGAFFARLLLCAIALMIGFLNLNAVTWVYAFVPALLAVIALIDRKSPKTSLFPGKLSGEIASELGSYNFWIIVSMFCTNLIGNIDSHFVAYFHDNHALSSFGVSSKLTMPIQFIITALTATMLPRLSAATEVNTIRKYLSQMKVFLTICAAGVGLLCWLAPPILIWVAGPRYADITPLIRLQIFTMLIVLITNPVGLVLYAWGWSQKFAVLNVFQAVLLLGLDYLLVPRLGAMGAVTSTLCINLIGMVYVFSSVRSGLKKMAIP